MTQQMIKANKLRERMLEMILEAKDANGNQIVCLNDDQAFDVPEELPFLQMTKVVHKEDPSL